MSIPWMVEVLDVRESLKKCSLCIGNVLFVILLVMITQPQLSPVSILGCRDTFNTLLCIARHSLCLVLQGRVTLEVMRES